MNHKTLSDFRVGQGAVLEGLLVNSFAALLAAGVAGLERVAQDGVRVRASAGAASFRRHSTLEECRRRAKAEVARLRRDLDADPGAASRREAAARQRAAEDRERRVENALAVTAKLQTMQAEKVHQRAGRAANGGSDGGKSAAEEPVEKEPRASTTDAEARVMKMADGGFRPAYPARWQRPVRRRYEERCCSRGRGGQPRLGHGQDETDERGAAPSFREAAYGRRPAEHLADGGFAKLGDITALARAGVTPFVPVPAPKDKTRDRFALRPDDPPEVAAWRQRMASENAKAIYKERAATVECVNAQARNRGLTRFLVRGIDKVRAVALWHALAHNMACGWRLLPA